MRLFISLFRASRSLNNKVSTAQHEAILAQVFCHEVELCIFSMFRASFFHTVILGMLNNSLRKWPLIIVLPILIHQGWIVLETGRANSSPFMKQILSTQCVEELHLTLIPVNFAADFVTHEIWQWSVGHWRFVPRARDMSGDVREATAVAMKHPAMSKGKLLLMSLFLSL